MGKLRQFQIVFTGMSNGQNGNAKFRPGQVMTGKVIIVLNGNMKMRNVRLHFLGQASCIWTKRKTAGNGHTYKVTYRAVDEFFNECHVIWGKSTGSNADTHLMPSGRHELPFQFLIPSRCLPSLEDRYAHVRYSVKATIDRPWRLDNTTTTVFTVDQHYDLNNDPQAPLPIRTGGSREQGLWCCAGGTLSVNLSLPKCGFVPGEIVPIQLSINNTTSGVIKKIRVQLIQEIQFKAKGGDCFKTWKTKNFQYIVAENRKNEGISRGEHVDIKDAFLCIPRVPATTNTCPIITVEYFLWAKLTTSGLSAPIKLSVPITIGTIPIRQTSIPSAPSATAAVMPARRLIS